MLAAASQLSCLPQRMKFVSRFISRWCLFHLHLWLMNWTTYVLILSSSWFIHSFIHFFIRTYIRTSLSPVSLTSVPLCIAWLSFPLTACLHPFFPSFFLHDFIFIPPFHFHFLILQLFQVTCCRDVFSMRDLPFSSLSSSLASFFALSFTLSLCLYLSLCVFLSMFLSFCLSVSVAIFLFLPLSLISFFRFFPLSIFSFRCIYPALPLLPFSETYCRSLSVCISLAVYI